MARGRQRPQQVRILGGTLRGRAIAAPPGLDVRPTAARTREALFNLLMHGGYGPDGGNILAGAHVADLCCGTGALAFEALSRGAASAVLADKDRRTLHLAEQNAAKLGLAGQCRFVQAVLPGAVSGGPFQVIFLDPPYQSGLTAPILNALLQCGAIADGTIVAAETGTAEQLEAPAAMTLVDDRTYGAARLRVFRV